MKKAARILATAAAICGIVTAAWAARAGIDGVRVGQLLKARLPKTAISSIDCARVSGLCEVVAGKAVFYVDPSARYMMVGRVYDMQTRQDLTATRLLEINPASLLGGMGDAGSDGGREERAESTGSELAAPQALQGKPGAAAITASAPASAAQPQRAALSRIDLTELPPAGAIQWGKPSGRAVTIFTDFRCGYCRALVATLEQMDVHVTERPISVLGSRDVADRVYCARDKARAVRDAYAGLEVQSPACDTTGLDANERFAREHGFSGTPILVRSDGAVLEGYRPRQFLETWLSGS